MQIGENRRDICRDIVTLCSSPINIVKVERLLGLELIMEDFVKSGLDPEKMTQDYFKIAPFSKKRAAFYLTQAWSLPQVQHVQVSSRPF